MYVVVLCGFSVLLLMHSNGELDFVLVFIHIACQRELQ